MRAVIAVLVLLVSAGCALDPAGTCSADADCGTGRVCTSGVCVGCDRNADCRAWQSCNLSTRLCRAQAGRCTTANECFAWETCDTAAHTCNLTPGACNDAATDCRSYEDCTDHWCRLQRGRCDTVSDCPGFFASCDATNWCADEPADGNDILMLGEFSIGCGSAIAPLKNPRQHRLGLPWRPAFTTSSWAIRDPIGTFVYLDSDRSPLRPVEFVGGDLWTLVGTTIWQFPGNGNLNDTPRPATACVATDSVPHFVIQERTGAYAYVCGLAPYDWIDEAGGTLVTGATLRAWNQSGILLGTYGTDSTAVWSIWDAGTRTRRAVTGLPTSFSVLDARAAGDSFWLAVSPDSFSTTNLQLWVVNSSGVASRVAFYGAKPLIASLAPLYTGVLDKNGSFYAFDWDRTASGVDLVLKYPADGSAAVVAYTDRDGPIPQHCEPEAQWVFPYTLFRGP